MTLVDRGGENDRMLPKDAAIVLPCQIFIIVGLSVIVYRLSRLAVAAWPVL